MTRDPDRPGADGYTIRPLMMESAKEHQEWLKCLPPTEDLPTTHEHHITHRLLPDGRMCVEITVRLKAGAIEQEPDELNKLDDAGLEVEAAKAGLEIPAFRKLGSLTKKVKAIRDKRAVAV